MESTTKGSFAVVTRGLHPAAAVLRKEPGSSLRMSPGFTFRWHASA